MWFHHTRNTENKNSNHLHLPNRQMDKDRFYSAIPILEQAVESKFPLGSSTSFSSTGKNEKSIQNKKKSERKGKLTCPLCEASFQDRSEVEMHMIRFHKINKEKLEKIMTSLDKSNRVAEEDTSKHTPSTGTMPFNMNLTSTNYSSLDISDTRIIEDGGKKIHVCNTCNSHHADIQSLISHLVSISHHNMKFRPTFPENTCVPYADCFPNRGVNDLNQFSLSDPLYMDQNYLNQQAFNSMLSTSLPPTQTFFQSRKPSGPMFSSQEAFIQHHKLNSHLSKSPSLGSQTNMSQDDNTVLSSNLPKQNKETDTKIENQLKSLGYSEACANLDNQINHSNTKESKKSRTREFKSAIKRQILINYGLENVMQYNENSQYHSKDGSEMGENVKIKFPSKDTNDGESQIKDTASLESSRCICGFCGESFSGIWVLKSHCEEIHKLIVPNKDVENMAEEFRKTNKKNKINLAVGNVAEIPSFKSNADLIACENSASANTLNTTVSSAPNNVKTSKNKKNRKIKKDRASEFTPNYVDPQTVFQLKIYQQHMMNMMYGMGLTTPYNMDMNMNSPFGVASMLPPGAASPFMNPLMASTFFPPVMPVGGMDSQIPPGHQQLFQKQKKRRRTRKTYDQLEILRKYFDVNNAPTREQIEELSCKTGLTVTAINNWYRNAIFTERQRYSNSVYNFNNPPSTCLDTGENVKSGEIKDAGDKETNNKQKRSDNDDRRNKDPMLSDAKEHSFMANCASVNTTSSVIASKLDASSSTAPILPSTVFQDLKFSVTESSSNAHITEKTCMMPLEPFVLASFLETAATSMKILELKQKQPRENYLESSSKRHKTVFASQQTEYLWQQYEDSRFPSDSTMEDIARKIGVEKKSVRIWFKNARVKERKSGFCFQQILRKICPFCLEQFKSRLILKSHLETEHVNNYVKGTIDALCTGCEELHLATQESTSEEMSQVSPSVISLPGEHTDVKINSENSAKPLLLSSFITPNSEGNNQTKMDNSGEQLLSESLSLNIPPKGEINYSGRQKEITCPEKLLSASSWELPLNETLIKEISNSPVENSVLNHSDYKPDATDPPISDITEISPIIPGGTFPLDYSIPPTCTGKVNDKSE